MPEKAAFHQALVELTRDIAGRALDGALQDWLNQTHGPTSAAYQHIKAACLAGIAQGWLCEREGVVSATAASSRQKMRCSASRWMLLTCRTSRARTMRIRWAKST